MSQNKLLISGETDKDKGLDSQASAALSSSVENSTNIPRVDCPQCGHLNLEGLRICPNCQTILVPDDKTARLFGEEPAIDSGDRRPSGSVFLEHQPIVFDVDGQHIMLPKKTHIEIGRASPTPVTAIPDVDLTPFHGKEKGVSRFHIKLSVLEDMVYVMDMGSSNGTTVNGQRLSPQIHRLLRSGDELRLGQLQVKVRFGSE
jgi:hypothetical protein